LFNWVIRKKTEEKDLKIETFFINKLKSIMWALIILNGVELQLDTTFYLNLIDR
jgi:hypothetical protein